MVVGEEERKNQLVYLYLSAISEIEVTCKFQRKSELKKKHFGAEGNLNGSTYHNILQTSL
jgi:hypothetical protein